MSLYGRFIHARERRLTLRDTNRRVFPFQWGLEWLEDTSGSPPLEVLQRFSSQALEDSGSFFSAGAVRNIEQNGNTLSFDTPTPTSDTHNNRVRCRIFPAADRRAVTIVVPQWNSDPESHVSLCRILQKLGITAVRLSLPYHDERRTPGMERADHMVSPNIGRTLHATRQAVLEILQLTEWLTGQGYERVAVAGTSIGSCVTYLAFIHEPAICCGVFNHVSSHFADVVWKGLSTRYVRWGLEPNITLPELRDCWAPISPIHYIQRLEGQNRPHRLITARYDLSFPPDLSELVFEEYDRLGLSCDRVDLPCGHYTTASFPFKYMDGWHICSYLYRRLRR